MKSLLMKSLASLLLIGCISISYAAGDKTGSRVALPKYPEPVGEKCVAPTDEMRREHMNMILHQRDETVRDGIRGISAKYSLKDCIDCHAGYDEHDKPIPINAEGQFCESCHTYAAVSIDCFACHRTTPLENNPRRPALNTHQDMAPKKDQQEALAGSITGSIKDHQ